MTNTFVIEKLLKGMNIAIVGRSHELITRPIENQGQHIDSFDIVVRVNYVLPFFPYRHTNQFNPDDSFIPSPYHNLMGRKTNILYSTLENINAMFTATEAIEQFRQDGGKAVVCGNETYLQVINDKEQSLTKCPTLPFILNARHQHWRDKKLDPLKSAINPMGKNDPYTGTYAIDYILQHDIKSLTMIGFTCYQNTDKPTHNPKDTSHNALADLKWINKTITEDTRLRFQTK